MLSFCSSRQVIWLDSNYRSCRLYDKKQLRSLFSSFRLPVVNFHLASCNLPSKYAAWDHSRVFLNAYFRTSRFVVLYFMRSLPLLSNCSVSGNNPSRDSSSQ